MSRPEHLHASCIDGALYDTREHGWTMRPPLRPVFDRTFREITNAHQLKATLRAGSSTDWGGVPLYFVMADGEELSFKAARQELRLLLEAFKGNDEQWRVIGCETNWEDSLMVCCHTGEPIPNHCGFVADTDQDATAP